MKEIVERLKKNRDLEKAKSIVESAGYSVSESAREYINVEYTYNGDDVSDYLGHVKVRTGDRDEALKAARKYAMSKHPEDNPGHFKISKDNYTNIDVIDSDGYYLTTFEDSNEYKAEKSLREDDDERDGAAEASLNAMKSNSAYKEMADICTKYGYKLVSAYIEHGSPYISIRPNSSTEYAPEVYYNYKKFRSVVDTFEIQTISYGALSMSEYLKFMTSVNNAYDMVKELREVDYFSLYVSEEED